MRKQALLGLLGLLGICGSVMAAAVAVDDRSVASEKSSVSRAAVGELGPIDAQSSLDEEEPGIPDGVVPVLLDPNMQFEHVVKGADGQVRPGAGDAEGEVAGAEERLIYENILGIHGINFPSNQPVSDDISTTAPDGCNLTRYKFKVLGKVNPAGVGGAYTVHYGIYTNCPLAAGSTNAQRDLIRIPGTEGSITFPDDAPRTIEHVVPFLTPVALPTNVYLGLRFTRGNCGTVLGAPAMTGYSGDIYDFPGFPCNGFLGGFPELPHASFWVQMWGTTNCPDAYTAYKCQKPSGGTAMFGSNIQGADDVIMFVNNCQMIGYEVVVRGVGFYTFDSRRECDSQVIAGTERTFQVNASTTPQLQVARFTFSPPIAINTDRLYLAFKSSSNSSGPVIAGNQPIIGQTSEDLFILGLEGCEPIEPTQGVHGSINLAITCAGEQPIGACCDPYLTECNVGPDAGERCQCNAICQGGPENGFCCVTNADCDAPGTCQPVCAGAGSCEAVCRQTTELNCPFPLRGQELRPTWKQGEECDPDPFLPNACGVSSCCHIRINPVTGDEEEACVNYTRNECFNIPPLDKARLWQLGQYCGTGAQRCPRNACLARSGSCYIEHQTPGCQDPFCCTDICNLGSGAFCCNTAWDQACADLAEIHCSRAPGNDQCAPDFPVRGLEGALPIPVPGSSATNNVRGTDTQADPGFCCHNGVGVCESGATPGEPCIVDSDCPSLPQIPGTCSDRSPDPGATGLGSIWFKFTMPLGACQGGPNPGTSCSNSTQCRVCVGGANAGQLCTAAGDCPGGSCPTGGNCNAGTSAGVNTCTSNSPALDSIVQVFRAGDPSSPLNACSTLSVIGCNDDSLNCSSTHRNSRLCLRNLTPGETYYVLVTAKTENRRGQYRVSVSTSCSGPANDPILNDYCHRATGITDPTPANPLVVPFNLGAGCVGGSNAGLACTSAANCPGGSCQSGGATFECPADQCVPNAQNDIWYNYTATCTGEGTFSTCSGGVVNPDTNLVIYEDCAKCPPYSGTPMIGGCSDDVFSPGCGLASRFVVPVTQGQCYKVRLSDNNGGGGSGNLTITCNSGDCQPNGTQDVEDIANCPPGTGPASCQDCNDNGRPDECDIRDLIEQDCQPNGVPDSCELEDNDCQPDGIPDNCVCEDPCCGGGGDCSGFVSSVPANCSVDARRPHAPGIPPGAAQGTNSIAMTFGAECAAEPGDFTVTCVNGNIDPPPPCPTISTVVPAGATQTINLSGVIPAGSWTCVTHTATGAEVCTGSLPGDCNGNEFTAAADILTLVDHLNGVLAPPLTLEYCDMDRSGLCVGTDILTLVDMLNGANGFINWTGKTLPACPNP